MHDTYVNPLCTRYAGKEMQKLFSDNTKFTTWRKLWIALAESEQALGLPITDAQIAELKAQGESDRIDFRLQLAGVRNVKAARALLADHGNDVDKLKEAEPWLFEASGKHAKGGNAGSGTTGLPNAGAASDEGKTLKHWREIAGLTDSDDDKKKE